MIIITKGQIIVIKIIIMKTSETPPPDALENKKSEGNSFESADEQTTDEEIRQHFEAISIDELKSHLEVIKKNKAGNEGKLWLVEDIASNIPEVYKTSEKASNFLLEQKEAATKEVTSHER